MTRLILLPILLLCACASSYDDPGPPDYMAVYDELWTILVERYHVPSDPCERADRNLFLYEVDQDAINTVPGCVDKIGCTLSGFPPDVPEGAYTVLILETLSIRKQCEVAVHELIHVQARCLAQNVIWWRFDGEGHPPQLFDLDIAGLYPVELELEARAMEACVHE